MIERIEGEIIGFTFRSEDWAVARLRLADGGEAAVVGVLSQVQPGQRISGTGSWEQNNRFGRQFKLDSCLVESPATRDGLVRYLASAFTGIGNELAQRIVDRFGLDALRIVQEEPGKLVGIPGISRRKIEKIALEHEATAASAALQVTLRGHGLSPGLVARVMQQFGADAAAIIIRSPYRLTEVKGIGFRTADAIARSQGARPDDPPRVHAATLYLLREAEGEGSCFLPETVLRERLLRLEVTEAAATIGLDLLNAGGQLVRHNTDTPGEVACFLADIERRERRVAQALLARRHHELRPGLAEEIQNAERRVGLTLDGGQRAAVELALTERLVVITGGPGTGKTTILRVLLSIGTARQEAWACAAPTGRAAFRLSSGTGHPASTLHRLLEFSPKNGEFLRCASRPLDAAVVVVDETSMVDLVLLDHLLVALAEGARLILVGDADQLPSVGPGQVLRDIIGAGAVAVARLNEVYRQADDSGIVAAAHEVNRGRAPMSSERRGESRVRQDFFLVTKEHAEDAAAALLEIVGRRLPRLGFDPRRDVQVLTPVHAGPLGTVALSKSIQALLNPEGEQLERRGRVYRVSDRVIQTRNDYDLEVFNGDVGLVTAVAAGSMVVDFGGRSVTMIGEALDALELAWAISIHKSQGSEYPAVVVALHHSHYVMLRRTLLYTAITRARRFCCVVGSARALEVAVLREGGDERHTMLKQRLATG